MEIEKCTDRDEKIVPKDTIDRSTFKFCSQACASAYKEIANQKGEEIKEQEKRALVLVWRIPV